MVSKKCLVPMLSLTMFSLHAHKVVPKNQTTPMTKRALKMLRKKDKTKLLSGTWLKPQRSIVPLMKSKILLSVL
jgi:hypothetical protein